MFQSSKKAVWILGALVACVVFPHPFWGAETSVTAVSPDSLTFENAYHKILAYYPRLKSQKAKIEEAVAEKFSAYAALLPKVQGISSVTTGDDPVYVFGSLLKQERFAANNFALSSLNTPGHLTNFNFTLQAEVPIFNAFQTISRIRGSRFSIQSEKSDHELIKMESSLLALESYLKALLAKENLKMAKEVETQALDDLKQAQELKDKGMVLGADFYAAKMMMSEIKQMNHELDRDEQVARILLNILMGEPAEASYILSGKIPKKAETAKSLASWLEDADRARPDLIAFQAKVDAARVQTFKEKMSALPRIGGFGAVTEDSHDLTSGGENFVMGVKGTLDILDADYWVRIKKAKAVYEGLQQEYRAFKDQIAKEVSQAVRGFEAAALNRPISEEGFQDGSEAVKQTDSLYREGRKSIADLMQIRRAFLSTAFKRNELLFQSEMAYANLFFLSGTLDDKTIQDMGQRIDGVR